MCHKLIKSPLNFSRSSTTLFSLIHSLPIFWHIFSQCHIYFNCKGSSYHMKHQHSLKSYNFTAFTLNYIINTIYQEFFASGKFWRKWHLEGVFNFHWVLFLLFQGLSIKTFSRAYISLCLFLAISRRLWTQRKFNPLEKFPIYGTPNLIYQSKKYLKDNRMSVHEGIKTGFGRWSKSRIGDVGSEKVKHIYLYKIIYT